MLTMGTSQLSTNSNSEILEQHRCSRKQRPRRRDDVAQPSSHSHAYISRVSHPKIALPLHNHNHPKIATGGHLRRTAPTVTEQEEHQLGVVSQNTYTEMCKAIRDTYTRCCGHQETWTDQCYKKGKGCQLMIEDREKTLILCSTCTLVRTDKPTSIDEAAIVLWKDAVEEVQPPRRSLRKQVRRSLHRASSGFEQAARTTKTAFRATFGGPMDVFKAMDGAFGHDSMRRFKVPEARERTRRQQRGSKADCLSVDFTAYLDEIR